MTICKKSNYLLGQDAHKEGRHKDALKYWTLAHEEDDPDAALRIGMHYYFESKYAPAVKWLTIAAEKDDFTAQSVLVEIYTLGQVNPPDPQAMVKWITACAQRGSSLNQAMLAEMYEKGNLVAQDDDKAYHWYGMAATKGNPEAMRWMADMAFKSKHYEKVFEWSMRLIDTTPKEPVQEFTGGPTMHYGNRNPDPTALWRLADMAEHGKWIDQDIEAAAILHTQAYAAGVLKSGHSLVDFYLNGRGVPKNIAKAIRICEELAAKDDMVGLYYIGKLYDTASCGYPKDHEKATGLLNKSADQKYADALCAMGIRFYKGEYLHKNDFLAKHYFEEAVDQNHVESMLWLADLHTQSGSFFTDYQRGVDLLKRAKKMGSKKAVFRLKEEMFFNEKRQKYLKRYRKIKRK